MAKHQPLAHLASVGCLSKLRFVLLCDVVRAKACHAAAPARRIPTLPGDSSPVVSHPLALLDATTVSEARGMGSDPNKLANAPGVLQLVEIVDDALPPVADQGCQKNVVYFAPKRKKMINKHSKAVNNSMINSNSCY